jgi:hypothetical protein
MPQLTPLAFTRADVLFVAGLLALLLSVRIAGAAA